MCALACASICAVNDIMFSHTVMMIQYRDICILLRSTDSSLLVLAVLWLWLLFRRRACRILGSLCLSFLLICRMQTIGPALYILGLLPGLFAGIIWTWFCLYSQLWQFPLVYAVVLLNRCFWRYVLVLEPT